MDDNESEDLKKIAEEANELIKDKKYESALSLCEEAESRGLFDRWLYALHTFALIGLRRWQEASALVEEKLKEYPDEPRLYHAEAFLKYQKKQYKKAIDICDYAASLGVWDSGLASVKSAALLKRMRYKGAIQFMIEELENYPDNATLHLHLSFAYRAVGKPAKSRQELKAARALNPTLPELRIRVHISAIRVLLIAYFFVGICLLPGSRYFMIPLWLFLIGWAIWHLQASFMDRWLLGTLSWSVLILLIGFACYFVTFGLPS